MLLLMGPSFCALAESQVQPPAGLPALARYEGPVFPAELAARSILEGHALVAFTVRPDGSIDDAFALDASHPAFGDSAMTAVAQWWLKPALSATTPRRETIRFAFRREDAISTHSHLDASRNLFPEQADVRSTVSWQDLPRPPERIAGDRPAVPGAGPGGRAVVSFIIDPQGAVRVPVVTSATDAEFGAAALAAVKQWRYAPPRRDGSPVAVSLAQSFSYGPATP